MALADPHLLVSVFSCTRLPFLIQQNTASSGVCLSYDWGQGMETSVC